MGMLLALGGIFLLILIIGVGIAYVLGALTSLKILTAFGYQNTWHAWVPFMNLYAVGTCCTSTTDQNDTLIDQLKVPNFVIQWGWVIVMAIDFIPKVGGVLSTVAGVFYYGTVYRFIYSRLFGDNSLAMAIISGFLKIVFYIRILASGKDVLEVRSAPEDAYPQH